MDSIVARALLVADFIDSTLNSVPGDPLCPKALGLCSPLKAKVHFLFVRTTYPLHPRLLETAEHRLRVLPDYNLSRGTLRLFARMVRGVWDDAARDPELITAGDIDWSSPSIQTDLLQRLDRERFRAAFGADIESHAREQDSGAAWGMHRRVASALLLESLPLEANRLRQGLQGEAFGPRCRQARAEAMLRISARGGYSAGEQD